MFEQRVRGTQERMDRPTPAIGRLDRDDSVVKGAVQKSAASTTNPRRCTTQPPYYREDTFAE